MINAYTIIVMAIIGGCIGVGIAYIQHLRKVNRIQAKIILAQDVLIETYKKLSNTLREMREADQNK